MAGSSVIQALRVRISRKFHFGIPQIHRNPCLAAMTQRYKAGRVERIFLKQAEIPEEKGLKIMPSKN